MYLLKIYSDNTNFCDTSCERMFKEDITCCVVSSFLEIFPESIYQDMPGTVKRMIITNKKRENFRKLLEKVLLRRGGYGDIKYHPTSDNKGDNIYSRGKKVGVLTKKGAGANATVMKITFLHDNSKIAIKIGEINSIVRENSCLAILNQDSSKYIIKSLEPCECHDNLAAIIMPCYDTDLAHLIRSPELKSLGKDHVKHIFYSILAGLAKIHSCNIIHGDLKPENILLNANPLICVITDLGLAQGVWELLNMYVFSRWYRAPEIIKGIKYSFSADIWSLGCILYELVTGDILFRGTPCGYLSPDADEKPAPLDVKGGVWDLIIEEQKTHKAIKKFARMKNSDPDLVDLFGKLMMFEPSERITAQKALEHPYFRRET